MRAVLISTYELGRQPFGLASPAAWLRRAGIEVACIDTSRDPLRDIDLQAAGLVALYLPMHTATRLALRLLPRIRAAAPAAHLCGYGLYAVMNAPALRHAGVQSVLSGEFEAALTALALRLAAGEPAGAPTLTSLDRLHWAVPDRAGLPPLSRYARLEMPDGESRLVGTTDASRGCKHLCRHCPVVPVYNGNFRIVPVDVVLADIRQQVAAGADHISFGDPDFFNGITHALRVAAALHREFPHLGYDVTIKVEHLLRHAGRLAELRDTGCLFITTAVESFDNRILAKLDKGHTRDDFFRALDLTRAAGLPLNPTFVSFTPWTTTESFAEMCRLLASSGLASRVAPVQLGIRLLIPSGSRLLELPDAPQWLGAFDPVALSYAWRHPDPTVDDLGAQVQATVAQATAAHLSPAETFARVAGFPCSLPADVSPRLSEPWFCCAEPTADQFARQMG